MGFNHIGGFILVVPASDADLDRWIFDGDDIEVWIDCEGARLAFVSASLRTRRLAAGFGFGIGAWLFIGLL